MSNNQFSGGEYARKIRRGEEIECLGLKFSPLYMKDYDVWMNAKTALTIRQSTLPVSLAVKPYLAAIFQMEIESQSMNGENIGLWASIMLILCLALRLPFANCTDLIQPTLNEKNELKGLRIRQLLPDNDITVNITASQFERIRQLICAQNKEELPDESENPELVQAQIDLSKIHGTDLNISTSDLLASVAYKSNVREKDMDEWTIYEFISRHAAIQRDTMHGLNRIAEASGATWKTGNPYPSWCYERKEDMLGGFTPVGELLGKFGHDSSWIDNQMQQKE